MLYSKSPRISIYFIESFLHEFILTLIEEEGLLFIWLG